LARIFEERAEDSAKRKRTIRPNRHQGGVRKLPVSRVGHDAKSSEGQPMSIGNPGGNMGFRICDERTRLKMEGAPFSNSRNG
jgi:hypothetical protein